MRKSRKLTDQEKLVRARRKIKHLSGDVNYYSNRANSLKEESNKYRTTLNELLKWLAETNNPNRLYGIEKIAKVL